MAFASHSTPQDLWEKALTQFRSEEQRLLNTAPTDRRAALEEMLSLVRGAEKTCQEKRWKWKNRKGDFVIVRDVFVKMATWIEKFKGIGDNIVQYDPG
jgi:hypothetical protein